MEAEAQAAAAPEKKTEATERRRKPGRPRKDGNHRETILNKAEIAFAEGGYAGISIRDIAERAGVNQALIRYYFESKQQLFDEVYRRRGGLLSGRRHFLLDQLLEGGKPLTVKAIVRAYLQPQWDLKYSGEAGCAFRPVCTPSRRSMR